MYDKALSLYSFISSFRLRNNTEATTGAPINAVTELSGKAPSKPGIRAIRLQANAKVAPINTVAGINTRWSELRKMARAKWGTAKPINMIGPQ